jgi:glycosyltransferase involved in cell wall biosynthesis
MMQLVLTPTLTGHDGLSCLARQFVMALASNGGRLHVLTLDNGTSELYRWPPNVTISDARGSRSAFLWRAMQLQRKEAIRLVIVLHAHLLPAAWPFRKRGAAILPVFVGIEAWRPFSWAQKRVLSEALRGVAISHHTRREFQRANADLPLSIDVCWPATPPLSPTPSQAIVAPRYALIVARMSAEERYKGHDLLIDLWPEIAERVAGARLVIAGSGDDVARLERRVVEGGLTHAVEFVGRQSPDALAALYRDCAFLVMPSSHEGFGLVFLEAMSVGRACIGAPGSAQEIIVHGETGFVADPARPYDLRDAIVALFEQPELASRLGDAGRRRAADHFSFERFAHAVSDVVNLAAPARAAAAC